MKKNIQNIITELELWTNADSVNINLMSQLEQEIKNYVEFIRKYEFLNFVNLKSHKLSVILIELKNLTEKIYQVNKAYENILYYIELLQEELA